MPANPIYPRDREMSGWRWSSVLFNKKIDSTAGADQCWQWLGSRGPQGPLFGARRVQPDGTDIAQMTQARRVLFAEYTGQWPSQRQAVYHLCGNRNCMNFLHYTLDRPVPRQKPRQPRPAKLKPAARPVGRPVGSKTKKIKLGEAN